MKALPVAILLLLCRGPMLAQSVDSAFAGKTHCIEIELTAMKIIPDFYNQKQFDSIELVLAYVKDGCIENSSLRIVSMLLDMERGRFDENRLTAEDLYFIKLESKEIRSGHLSSIHRNPAVEQFIATESSGAFQKMMWGLLEQRLLNCMVNWASGCKDKEKKGSIAHYLLSTLMEDEPFSDHEFYQLIQKPEYKKSGLARAYWRYWDRHFTRSSFSMALELALSRPTQNLGKSMGLGGGVALLKTGYNFNARRFVQVFWGVGGRDARRSFPVIRPDTAFSGNRAHFNLFNVEFGQRLFRLGNRLHVYGLAGAGYYTLEYFTLGDLLGKTDEEARAISDKMGDDVADVISPTVGIETRYFLSSFFYLVGAGRWLLMPERKIQNEANLVGNELVGRPFLLNIGVGFNIRNKDEYTQKRKFIRRQKRIK
jgi:hypothetical protein